MIPGVPWHTAGPVTGPNSTLPDTSFSQSRRVDGRRGYLVLALQYEDPTAESTRFGLDGLSEVAIGRGDTRRATVRIRGGTQTLRIDVADPRISTDHARLVAHGDTWRLEDAGSMNGSHVNGRRVDQTELVDGDVIEIGRTVFVFRAPSTSSELERETMARSLAGLPVALRTFSAPFAADLETLQRVAGTAVPVTVSGPTGTGKELTARAVHELSGRRGDFVAVNCGAIAGSILESELFGYKKGAFSGANEDRPGLVRAADKGTLFLDEVAELPAAAQVALLRVLQEGEVVPVGATAPISVDVRVITATHRPLLAHVEDGSFREDLFARLSGHHITLPPLADRREDLGLLLGELFARTGAYPFTRAAARAVFAYDWPRNIRELHRILESAIAALDGGVIELDALPEPLRDAHDTFGQPAEPADRDAALRAEIIGHLEANKGNVTATAAAMGKSRGHLHRLLARLEIDADRYR